MEISIPQDVLKKPVFSQLEKHNERVIAYQAYLALQELVFNDNRAAIDALLEDEKNEALLTDDRHELESMGITILAALRKLIEQEKREATLALSLKNQA
jgi:hypothetical protein